MEVQILGSGTPFGEDGRLQSCILVSTRTRNLLLDCGMTSMVGLARAGVAPESVDVIALSHLHGDHFGGVPLLLLDRAVRQVRRRLIVAGPDGAADAVRDVLTVLRWPRAWSYAQVTHAVEFVVLRDRQVAQVAGFDVTSFDVPHYPRPEPCALRISAEGKVVAYSGDAGWSPALVEAADGADLFVCSVLEFSDADPAFLDFRTFREHQQQFNARRIIVTHAASSLLAHRAEIDVEVAVDGLRVTL